MTHHTLHVQVEHRQIVDDYGTLIEPAEVYYSIECPGYDPKQCSRSLYECPDDCRDPDEDPAWEAAANAPRDSPEYQAWDDAMTDYQDAHPWPGWHESDPPECWESRWANPNDCDFDPITEPWAFIQGSHPVIIERPAWCDIEDTAVYIIYAPEMAQS